MSQANFLRRNPAFARLWVGQLFCQASTRMFQMAMTWWLVSHAGERAGLATGGFLVAAALPSLVLLKLIGRTVDRVDPRSLLIRMDLLAAGVSLLFAALTFSGALAGGAGIPVLYATVFFLSICQAYYDPTLNRAAPSLVPSNDLESAVAYMTSTQSIASFAGAVLGALLIGSLGVTGVALLNVAGYAISCAMNYGLPVKKIEAPVAQATAVAETPASDTTWNFLGRYPRERQLLFAFGLVNFFLTPVLIVLPNYVSSVLKADARTLGALEASLCLGLIAGTFAAERVKIPGTIARAGGILMAAIGVALAAPGFVAFVPVYASALALVGFSLGVNNVKFVSHFQRVIPEAVKGRFFASLQAVVGFTGPVSFIFFGGLLDALAPRATSLVQSAGIVLLSLWFFQLDRTPAPAIHAQQAEATAP